MGSINRLKSVKSGKVKRWTNLAYSHYGKPKKNFWSGGNEGFLKREFLEFNVNPAMTYQKFLNSVAYSLECSISQVRSKLREMNAKGYIPKRTH